LESKYSAVIRQVNPCNSEGLEKKSRSCDRLCLSGIIIDDLSDLILPSATFRLSGADPIRRPHRQSIKSPVERKWWRQTR
ncbi:MAG: hypothetical protein ABIE92_08015, partial [bacterium]